MDRRIAHGILLVAVFACGCSASATVEGSTIPDAATDAGTIKAAAVTDASRGATTSSATDALAALIDTSMDATDAEASPDDSASADTSTEAAVDAAAAWTGACTSCYSAAGCEAGRRPGFVCSADCTTAPPINAGGCTDAIVTPYDAQTGASATLLWCCPSDPGGPPPNAGPPDRGSTDAESAAISNAGTSDAGSEGCAALTSCPTGDNCDSVPNGCGGAIDCGATCVAPETCGGGGSANVCGCTPMCSGKNCGDDGCGSSCGTCGATQICGVGLCTKPGLNVVAGQDFSCALLADGTVECWGYNGDGELGTGSTGSSPTPAAVPSLSGVSAITANQDHTCVLLSGGTIDCWGAAEGSPQKFRQKRVGLGIHSVRQSFDAG